MADMPTIEPLLDCSQITGFQNIISAAYIYVNATPDKFTLHLYILRYILAT